MVYHYQDTIITVQPGIGMDNWATCKLKPSGSWGTVRSKDMPRVNSFTDAVNNLHEWAEKKQLKRADCGCCYYWLPTESGHKCRKHDCNLKSVELMGYGVKPLRCDRCTEFEKKVG